MAHAGGRETAAVRQAPELVGLEVVAASASGGSPAQYTVQH